MPTTPPLFSIIVPIYNEEKFIRQALDSILEQTDSDWEAILVDDGSTDTTPGILDEYARQDNRFRVFHKSNGGQSSAINLGVKEARGTWLCWLSGDDYFHPQKLEFNRRWIQDYPEIQFFFTGFWLIQPDGQKIEYPLEWLELENRAYHLMQLLRSNWVMGISICINREVWMKTGEFDGRLRYAHDMDMWVRLMLNANSRYFPERTCTMRYHPGQETARFPLAPAFDAAKIAIRLINQYSFKELFPIADLSNRTTALEMLNRTIDIVAGEPKSNVYMQGVHPLLHFRMLEWVYSKGNDSKLKEELRAAILNKAKNIIPLHFKTPFGLIWQATCAALSLKEPNFAYFPCEPKDVGALNYYVQRTEAPDAARILRSYLEQYDGLTFQDAPISVEKPGQLIFLLPPDVSLDAPPDALRKFWKDLIEIGYFILLVGKSRYSMGLIDGLPYLGADSLSEQDKLIDELGELDTVVTFSGPERLRNLKSERTISLSLPHDMSFGQDAATQLVNKIRNSQRKKRISALLEKRLTYARLLPSRIKRRLKHISVSAHTRYSVYKNIPPKQLIIHAVSRIYQILIHPSLREKISLGPKIRTIKSFLNNLSLSGKKHLVFIVYALWGGGVEKVLYELVHSLDANKFNITVVYLHSADNLIPYDPRIKTIYLQPTFEPVPSYDLLPKQLREINLRSSSSPDAQVKYSLMDAVSEIWPFASSLQKLLDILPKDALLIPMDERNTVILWLSQASPKHKILASQHYPYSQAQKIRFPNEEMRAAKQALYLAACESADVVTFDSQASRWDFITNFGSSPKRTLYMPNLINSASVIQKSQQMVLDNTETSKTIFTQVARMAHEKNPLLLIDACEVLLNRYRDFVVFYIGNGPLFDEMREQINKRGLKDHILLLGELANPYPYVSKARALLLTSSAESSPLVVTEAMLCKTVPIATDCLAGPRELLGNGKYGILVSPNDPEAFAEAMYQIATDDKLYESLQEKAFEWALRLDTLNAIQEWDELIVSIMENRSDEWISNNKKDDSQ